jgi:hypothetical protein
MAYLAAPRGRERLPVVKNFSGRNAAVIGLASSRAALRAHFSFLMV